MAPRPARMLTSLTVAVLLTTAGCGSQGSPLGAGEPTRAAGTGSGATDAPTDGTTTGGTTIGAPETTSPSPAESQTPTTLRSATPRPAGLRSGLLTAERLPTLAAGSSWRAAGTEAESADPFGVCQKTSLTTIGALHAVVRKYLPADGAGVPSAAQVVGEFADAQSAWRAYEVLKSWRGQCPEFLDFTDEHVSGLTGVAVGAGVGHHFLMRYRVAAGNEPQLVAFGITHAGRFVSIVQFHTVGPDYDYRAGREPETLAVRMITARIAALA